MALPADAHYRAVAIRQICTQSVVLMFSLQGAVSSLRLGVTFAAVCFTLSRAAPIAQCAISDVSLRWEIDAGLSFAV